MNIIYIKEISLKNAIPQYNMETFIMKYTSKTIAPYHFDSIVWIERYRIFL